jgi:iron complex transport system substrate-binding protein
VKTSRITAIVLAAGFALAACGGTGTTTDARTEGKGAAGGGGSTKYPLTVENCGTQVTIPARPENVLLTSLSPVGYVEAVGAFDQVSTIVIAYSSPEYELFDHPAALKFVNGLTRLSPEGGAENVALEKVIGARPDLVIGGETDSVTRAGLAQVGIPMLVLPGFCGDGHTAVLDNLDLGFVLDQVEFWGEVLDQPEAAARSVQALQTRIDAVHRKVGNAPERTAATVYACLDGSCFGAYGTSSMAQPQLTEAGFHNVFDDLHGRYNETSVESLIDRDPEFLVILGGEQDDDQKLITYFKTLPGVSGLQAVKNNNLLVIPFGHTDPPNPYSIDGLEAIVKRFYA